MQEKNIYFVGIGGAGMSALAGLLHAQGILVSGSDRDKNEHIERLKSEGVSIFFGHTAEQVPEACDLLVYSAAVPEENEERSEARRRGVREITYFEALGEVSAAYTTLAVAGTHGKTTTTAMLALALEHLDPTVIVGSVMKHIGSNVRVGKSKYLIVEACEYKDHFLHLSPTVLVITNIELDHTDYFKDLDQMLASYRKLVAKIPEDGLVVVNGMDSNVAKVVEGVRAPVVDYTKVSVPELLVPGAFNVLNAKAAKAAAEFFGEDEQYDGALGSFVGTHRRFEFKGTGHNGALVYDDYAHHPTAVAATITAAKEYFPGKKIVIAFHPHLYSRTRDFMNEFAQAFSNADKVYVAPIFPAREVFDGETTNTKLAEHIGAAGGVAETFEEPQELEAIIESYDEHTLFMTMGAGDMYTWIPEYISTKQDM